MAKTCTQPKIASHLSSPYKMRDYFCTVTCALVYESLMRLLLQPSHTCDNAGMKQSITKFPELNNILRAFVDGIRPILDDNLVGVYLQGSFAVGAGDEHSDCDIVIVIREPLSAETKTQLTTVHKDLYEYPGYWSKHLEGSYFPADQLRRWTPNQPLLTYFDNGSTDFELSDHDNSYIVRWTLREHGITLYGPPIRELVDEVSAEALKQEVRQFMAEWETYLEANPDCYTNRWCQAYAVVSHCRMLRSLQTGRVHSKAEAAQWGIDHLDPQWADLIKRAQANRVGQYLSIRKLNHPEDTARTPAFLHYMRQLAQ